MNNKIMSRKKLDQGEGSDVLKSNDDVAMLRDLKRRVLQVIRPFRKEFLEIVRSGKSFGKDSAGAAVEINALLDLLGLELKDPEDVSRVAHVRWKDVPGVEDGQLEVRTQIEKQRKTLSSRKSLPENLVIGEKENAKDSSS